MIDKRLRNVKFLWTAIVIVIAVLALTVYFLQGQWEGKVGSEGHYSAETYLEGGFAECRFFTNKARLKYSYIIESGGMCFELTDEQGNIVFEHEFKESGSGYLAIEDVNPGNYYYHEYAISEDTVADVNWWLQEKKNNFMLFLRRINRWSQYRLFGLDFWEH